MFMNDEYFIDEFNTVVLVKDAENYYNNEFEYEDFAIEILERGLNMVKWQELNEDHKGIFIESVEWYSDLQCRDILTPSIKRNSPIYDYLEYFFE